MIVCPNHHAITNDNGVYVRHDANRVHHEIFRCEKCCPTTGCDYQPWQPDCSCTFTVRIEPAP